MRVRGESVVGVGEYSDVIELMTLPGAPLPELLDQPEQVLVTATASDTLLIIWTIPQVCVYIKCMYVRMCMYVCMCVQVLEMTAYNHTMLSVQNLTGDEVFFLMMTPSPTQVSDLTPATDYVVSLSLVFVGGELGSLVNATATTLEGGELMQ